MKTTFDYEVTHETAERTMTFHLEAGLKVIVDVENRKMHRVYKGKIETDSIEGMTIDEFEQCLTNLSRSTN